MRVAYANSTGGSGRATPEEPEGPEARMGALSIGATEPAGEDEQPSELEQAYMEIDALNKVVADLKSELAKKEAAEKKAGGETVASLMERVSGLRRTVQQLNRIIQGKCEVSVPRGGRTCKLALGDVDAADAGICEALSPVYDDVMTMVVCGLSADMAALKEVFGQCGVPSQALFGAEYLHQDYVLLSTATSFRAEVMGVLEDLGAEVVAPEDASVSRIVGISDGDRASLAQKIEDRLAARLDDMRARQLYVQADQVTRLAARAGIWTAAAALPDSGRFHNFGRR
ncbi:hypothetical protein H4R18_005193 [Coemansia javaensis]|uniref:Uncharacterized protein n=1 Tax=Coemansia javaensis TaxID=2761396 RepID=A0A9W8LEP5_9FUNG|nr:hypothetical protein H4R18_005193 [Coemansia javaensis]